MENLTTEKQTLLDKVILSKSLLLLLLCCMAGGISILLIGVIINNFIFGGWLMTIFFVLGYGVYAAPIFLAFVFKAGIFVDIGPIFYESQTRIGNIIYKTIERDYIGQAAGSFFVSVIKVLIMAVCAIFLTPIVTFVTFVYYKKKRMDAVKYCKENNISESEVPTFNKKIILIMGCVIIGLIIAGIVTDRIGSKIEENKANELIEKYEPALNKQIEDMPVEYFAETIFINQNVQKQGGYAAEFKIGEKNVLAGKLNNNFLNDYNPLAQDKGLSGDTEYFIIDGVVYLKIDASSEFIVSTDSDINAYLVNRHLSSISKDEAKLIDVTDRLDQLEKWVELQFECKENEFTFYIDGNDTFLYYSIGHYYKNTSVGENMFQIVENEAKIAELKIVAESIINDN